MSKYNLFHSGFDSVSDSDTDDSKRKGKKSKLGKLRLEKISDDELSEVGSDEVNISIFPPSSPRYQDLARSEQIIKIECWGADLEQWVLMPGRGGGGDVPLQ